MDAGEPNSATRDDDDFDDFDVFDGDEDDSFASRRRRKTEKSSSVHSDDDDGDEGGGDGRDRTAEEFAEWERERKKSGKDGGDAGGVASMMERLAQEAELGTFRALPPKYAAQAAAWHRKLAEGRVSRCSTVLSAATETATADGKPVAAAEEELHLRDAKGAVLAAGYRRTVGDEHGYYVEFGLSQLNHELKLQKQMRTKLSEEYAWTRFKAPGGVDVYYAGDDPFLQKQQQQSTPPPPPTTDASKIAPPAAAAATEIPNKRQYTMEKFFGAAKSAGGGGGQKRPRVPAAKSSVKRKHSRFARDVFYVRALDVVGAPKI